MSLDDFRSYVESVRQANPIAEVIGSDTQLRRVGRTLMCSSPLRSGDRNPSFAIYDDEDRWYDFGTGEHGDVFAYVMARDGVEFREAVDTLASRAALEVWGQRDNVDRPTREAIEALIERRWIAELIDKAADYYHRQLPTAIRAMVRTNYGLTDEHIDRFRVGWADGGLLIYMQTEVGESIDRLIKTGLFVRTRNGLIDFFERRIMFPYFENGLARYMIGRRVEGHTDDNEYERGKYKKQLKHGGRHEYVSRHVSHILYGLDSLRGRRDVLVITEGITDAMSSIAAGLPTISPVTVTFRDADIERIVEIAKRFRRAIIFNDLDEESGAGTKGALKTAAALFRAGVDVRIVNLRAVGAAA